MLKSWLCSQFLLPANVHPGSQASSDRFPITRMGDLDGVPSSLLWPPPLLIVADIWGEKQQIGALSICLYLCP